MPRFTVLLRRRRIATLLAATGLFFILVSSFGFPGSIGRNSSDIFDNSDYDLNYDSVDAVHAMVRQMSSLKRSRNQLQFDYDHGETTKSATRVSAPQKNNDLKYEPFENHRNHQKQKVRIGIGDYPDIPEDVPKKYSFIHQQQKTTPLNFATHLGLSPVNVEHKPVVYQFANNENDNDINEQNKGYENLIAEQLDNPEDEDSYEEDYNDENNPDNIIIEAQENENYEEDEEEYDYRNPNPVFQADDFDAVDANATKKKPFQFEELADEDKQNRLSLGEYDAEDYKHNNADDEDSVVYDDNDVNNDDYAVQHDTHVNGRMLHSKLTVVLLTEGIKQPQGHSHKDILDINKVLNSDMTRFHTPIKRPGSDSQRHSSTNERVNSSHNLGYGSKTIRNKVPNVEHSFMQNNLQNVIETPPVILPDDSEPVKRVVWLPRKRSKLEQPATQIQTPKLPHKLGPVVYSNDGYPVVEDSIYWSQKVESYVPKGLSDSDIEKFIHQVNHIPVAEMHDPKWNRCGRAKNQYVVLSDGTAMCARYRDPHNKLIHGEVLSFYLSRMLGLDAVPAVALAKVNGSATQWKGQNLTHAQWEEGKMVAMIQWIDGLDKERSRVKMPSIILNAHDMGGTLDRHHPAIIAMTPAELSDLVQWSDMLLFDYITGHYDRFASMQDGADRERKPSILAESVRNLRKVPETGKMWLIDNESGLFDAYELLYRGREMGQKFIEFHQKMLRTFCIFRQSTVSRVKSMAMHSSPDDLLLQYAYKREPFLQQMPRTAEYKLFKGYFHTRLKEVYSWIEKCERSH